MLLIKKHQQGVTQNYSWNYKLTELNVMEHGNSSPNLKVRVSSPLM